MIRKNNIKIGNKFIGPNQPVFIIAEAGVNHNHQLDLALKLVDAAADAGADAVKFQTFRAEQVVTPEAKMAGYQRKNIGQAESQFAMLKKLELKEEYYPELIKYANKKNIVFLSTPHGGFQSVDFLHSLNVPAFKFGSGDLNNLPLLQYAAKFKKPMILSTGMGNVVEIKEAVATVKKAGNQKIILLHCTTDYPCRFEDINLRAMKTLMNFPGILVGYSDHTHDTQTSVMAATLDACVVEKHLTLDKNLPGPDHKTSLEPGEFKNLVEQLRKIPVILGSFKKAPTKRELKYLPLVRKSIVTTVDIKKGEKFTKENLGIKRPGIGLSPRYYSSIISKISRRDIKADTLINRKHYEK